MATPRVRVGDQLVRTGTISQTVLLEALEDQRRQDQKIGRILIANRAISDDDLVDALSSQSGLGRIDLHQTPCDPDLFAEIDPYVCLELEAVPWKLSGDTLTVAIANPELGQKVIETFESGLHRIVLALAKPAEIRDAIMLNCVGQLRADAKTRCPEALSCRRWTQKIQGARRFRWLGLALLAAFALRPGPFLHVLMVWILVANSATMGLRLIALFTRAAKGRQAPPPEAATRLADHQKLPRISILVPLYHEQAVAQNLLAALQAMDYPAPLLDIKLVLEEDDETTLAAIARSDLPPNIEPLVVPNDGLKTKPRAMNYALPFCLGEIVGIYDAEDRPEPSQLRKIVEHLRTAPRDVACVQGFLDFYNPRQNWLARCFTLEYAIWFRVVLLGVQRLGLPIPLGGTTVFFRRRILEQIGAWDAHNVTEDADLGMRLARFGYRCEMVHTTTLEEANCHLTRWIKQRSRWLKGYVVTWATHMRNPRALFNDLGWHSFLGFQVLFLGAITSYLSLPLFWAIWIGAWGFHAPFWDSYPRWMLEGFLLSMTLGQIVMLVTAIVAACDSKHTHLIKWIPSLVFYWPFGAAAAYMAMGEIFARPCYWHKTEHGHSIRPGDPAPRVPFKPRVVSLPSGAESRMPG
jgi:glycosyltransferase XagB